MVSASINWALLVQEEVEQTKELVEQHAAEAASAQKQLAKAERQIERLKALLDSERSKPSKPVKIVRISLI